MQGPDAAGRKASHQEVPFSGQTGTTETWPKKKKKKDSGAPFKRCLVSFRFLNGIISKHPIKNESECVL